MLATNGVSENPAENPIGDLERDRDRMECVEDKGDNDKTREFLVLFIRENRIDSAITGVGI